MKVCDLFSMEAARSKSTDDYSVGDVPFVTSSELNNGVVAYVEPMEDDKVFDGPAICISGLGHATVHTARFLPKGNGGDSCTILKPIVPLEAVDVLYYAALFNVLHRWRFSYGRKASKRRLETLEMTPHHNNAPLKLAETIGNGNEMMLQILRNKRTALTK